MFGERPNPAADRAAVRAHLLAHRPNLRQPAFTRLAPTDLRSLYEQYDARSFGGTLQRTLAGTPLTFRVSRRMTNSLGLTYRYSPPLRFE
ncbi:MAG: hypothetical protein KC613_03250, partial [Myxococcales bacterium]|nr:hypothetical protein [Myxococcales bacterium]